MISMPSFGEPVRWLMTCAWHFLREIKHSNSRLHGQLLGLLLEEGLETFVASVSNDLNRPIAVETADFKVIASQNMGGTPANQQRTLSDEVQSALKRATPRKGTDIDQGIYLSVVRIGAAARVANMSERCCRRLSLRHGAPQ